MVVLGILAVAAFALIALYFLQRQLQYFPTRRDSTGKGEGAFLPFKTQEGKFLGYFSVPDQADFALLVFHGNAGEALDRQWMGELADQRGICVLAEYPGYGASGGTPSQAAILAQALEIFDEMRVRWPKVPIVVLGESLGTASATYLSAHRDIARLGLIAPFSSALEVAERHYRWLPVRLLMRDRFPSIEYVKQARAPLHIVHGTQDDLIPIELARKLFDTYPASDKAFTEVLGFGHNGLEWPILHSPFCEEFRSFLTEPRDSNR